MHGRGHLIRTRRGASTKLPTQQTQLVNITMCDFSPVGYWFVIIWQPAPRRIFFGGGGIYIFNAKFKWAILKIKAKITLLQFFWPYPP